jgi:hypothetical protein
VVSILVSGMSASEGYTDDSIDGGVAESVDGLPEGLEGLVEVVLGGAVRALGSGQVFFVLDGGTIEAAEHFGELGVGEGVEMATEAVAFVLCNPVDTAPKKTGQPRLRLPHSFVQQRERRASITRVTS